MDIVYYLKRIETIYNVNKRNNGIEMTEMIIKRIKMIGTIGIKSGLSLILYVIVQYNVEI